MDRAWRARMARAAGWGVPLAWLSGMVLTLVPAAAASDMGLATASQVSFVQYRDYLDNKLYTRGSHSRGPFGAAHDPARDNIVALFQSFGLDVTVEPFSWGGGTYKNVVATKWGLVHPSRQYLLGAHYDSASTPGADDDASGVALVLEAARVLSQYDTEYTIRFVAFDLKEQGLLGSQAYLSPTAHGADNILGMISADMVAYDPETDQALIQGPPLAQTLKQGLSAALAVYGGLSAVLQGDSLSSDHQRFVSAGIPACLLAERQAASNPYVHTQADTVDTANYINYAYAVKMTRGAVGFLADHAGASGLRFVYPSGRPAWLDPAGGTRLRVEVQPAGLTPQPGTGLLHYDLGGGFTTVPMTQTAPNVYEGAFPPVACGRSVFYRVTAETAGGFLMSSPAATRAHRAVAGYGGSIYFADEFEGDSGWTVQNSTNPKLTDGAWDRGVPVNCNRGDPPNDYDGSGQCYLTDNSAASSCNSDVDGGYTRLISPLIDLSGGDAEIRYALWYTNNTGSNPNSDRFKTYISNNGGQSWTLVHTFGPVTAPGWSEQRFNVGQIVVPTNQVRVRFEAADLGGDSTVEAAIDGFMVVSYNCEGGCTGPADGDLNGDGFVNGRDVQSFVDALLTGASADAVCHGDFTGNGSLDASDIPGFVDALLAE
jgi:hypothetical protein